MKKHRFQLHDICNSVGQPKDVVVNELKAKNILPYTITVKEKKRSYRLFYYTTKQFQMAKDIFKNVDVDFLILPSKLNYLETL